MKLLALDQSSKITGYAVFDDNTLVIYGKIDAGEADLPARLTKLRNAVKSLIDEYGIDLVALEDI
jgi:Holliday junction resolvasome RuvABC endonuclease subunit